MGPSLGLSPLVLLGLGLDRDLVVDTVQSVEGIRGDEVLHSNLAGHWTIAFIHFDKSESINLLITDSSDSEHGNLLDFGIVCQCFDCTSLVPASVVGAIG